MDDLIELIVSIFIIATVIVAKLIEAGRKKMPLPLPKPQPQAEEPKEEYQLGSSVEWTEIGKIEEVKKKIEKSVKVPCVIPAIRFSRDELQNGIILSTILGPPRSLSRFKPRMYLFSCFP